MYVCVCNAVSDRAIKKAVQQGCDSYEQIQCELRVGTCCGRCKDMACQLIEETKQELRAYPITRIDLAFA